MKYAVNEHFYSMQGEGVHTGRAAYFLRLQGCDQKCHFCDSAGTWHPDHIPAALFHGHANAVVDLVDAPPGAFVVLTGGEPTLYDLVPLVDALHARGYKVHLETAGHRLIRGPLDWITLSPKYFAAEPLHSSWLYADEIKLIIESPRQLETALALTRLAPIKATAPIWLHPEWSKREDPKVLGAIIEAVKADPRLRAGWQAHKLYAADLLDPNASKALIPLGGVTRAVLSTHLITQAEADSAIRHHPV